jgi:hypothetical protein
LIKGFAIKIVSHRAQLAPAPHEDRLPLDRNNAPMPSAHRNCVQRMETTNDGDSIFFKEPLPSTNPDPNNPTGVTFS